MTPDLPVGSRVTADSVRSSGLIEQRDFKRFSCLLLDDSDHNIQLDSTFSVVSGECGKVVVIREKEFLNIKDYSVIVKFETRICEMCSLCKDRLPMYYK